MPKIKLTDAAVERLKAPDGARVDYFDATLPGFGLRVSGPTERSPQGRKSWVLFYRHRGAQKRLTLDPVYPALGLSDARKRAGDALALLSLGKDPADEKAANKSAAKDTVRTVAERFLANAKTKKGKPWSARYKDEVERNLNNHVLPRWGALDIHSITRRDVNDLLDQVAEAGSTISGEEGKRHVPGGAIAANRVLAVIRAMLNFAIRRGILETAPVTEIEPRGEEVQRERVLSDDELRFLWPRFDARGYPFGHFFKMALITAQRRDEVAGMLEQEINDAEQLWSLPKERTKGRRPHVVPLSTIATTILSDARTAAATLAKAKKRKRGALIFSTTIESPISGYSRAKATLDATVAKDRKKQKLPALEPWTIHDLRRTAATKMGELGVERFIISKVLNHADREVTAIYDRHAYLTEKRHALDLWAQRLSEIVGTKSAKVESLQEHRRQRSGTR
jgi:integrase